MIFDVDYALHIIRSNQILRSIHDNLLDHKTEEAINDIDHAIAELRLARAAIRTASPSYKSQMPSPE
jgi:hypothetical protein